MNNGKRTAASIFGGKSRGHPDFKREEKKTTKTTKPSLS